MFRKLIVAASIAALASSPVFAAPCKDAKGKFTKCPTTTKTITTTKAAPMAATAPETKVKATVKTTHTKTTTTSRCRNAKGQFAKCGTPGAKPA